MSSFATNLACNCPGPLLGGLLCVWLLLTSSCSLQRNPVPRNADPEEADAVAVLRPLAEHIWFDEEGHVKSVDLIGIRATGEVMTAICDLKHLEFLDLCGAEVFDDQLAVLTRLPRLHSLGLSWTPVSDQGVQHVIKIPSLRLIDLRRTKVTDQAVELLATRRDLTHIFLTGSMVTGEGVSRLRNALPNAHIQCK